MSDYSDLIATEEAPMDNEKGTPLVVTTAHRGVFFGYGEPTNQSTIILTGARMCVYWPQSVQGVMGLASSGPLSGSRVSPAIPKITLQDVTSVMEVTSRAVKQWEKGPWT